MSTIIESHRIDKSLVILEDIQEGSEKRKIPWNELLQFILIRVRTIMFNKDGTPRKSGLIRKALLIAFAFELSVKVVSLIFEHIHPQPSATDPLELQ